MNLSQTYEVLVETGRNGHGKTIVPLDKIGKKIIVDECQYKTILIKDCKRKKNAETRARKFGRIIWCHKVDPTHYLYGIEGLNPELCVKPLSFEIIDDTVTLNKLLEVEKHRKRREFKVEIIDK